ncbi:cyclophane-forming radical SAM/SPASM peptide maturase GrrM/OscB [Bradyrhizobium japonicum]|uniref:cyclophane-forming radical SAM/SPASM peptide maturase GrrM/OscB n=1 Tax=Bradyrhizobium japonicum TaxID=375 RepID=UPI00271506E7|nr:cyclophane-forming radical SAM/SPASM peptide maturase GrrM/OscB [Bradyrhizobium japonicum]WLB53898.1 cyclophane-forming radical SAM/SPASM peptide maturase GrrM/OscB [Bradyrhizobium japonicum]WLB64229.1 cyclophane-forming radical SAM/SPASM peptide maturase GrrM/OscB [Bradyrhizobium japonicum]
MLVLQSTPFCNINCSYCYLPNRSSKARMNQKTIERVFDSLAKANYLSDALTVLWHAGEPLTVGIEYYERAFAVIRERTPPGVRVIHNFQTNGTLLNSEWAKFFRKHGATVGLSLDGPQHLHDRNRRTRRNQGTFLQAIRAVEVLKQENVPFHVITVLTRNSLRSARELFSFYLEIEASDVGFNIDEIEGDYVSSSFETDRSTDECMRLFFEEIYDLCESNPGKLRIREIEGALHAIMDPESVAYGNPLAEPIRMLNVASNGDLSTFSPELLGYSSPKHGSFAFGNIHEIEISELLGSSSYKAVDTEIRNGLAKCEAECEYFQLCRGGAPVNKYFENGTFDSTETLFCRLTKKAVIDVVLRRLEVALTAV